MSRNYAGLSRLTDGGRGHAGQAGRPKRLWLLRPDTSEPAQHLSPSEAGGGPLPGEQTPRPEAVGVQVDRQAGGSEGRCLGQLGPGRKLPLEPQ